MHGAPQRRQLRDLVADDEQLQLVDPAGAARERLDQPHEVLVRLDVADVEDELVIELVALADARRPLLGGVSREVLVDGVVDDDDLLRRDVEEVEDVALRRLETRSGCDPIGARPSTSTRAHRHRPPGSAVLREHQVDAVVDRDDRAARDRGRQHVVRRVVDVGPLAPQHPRHVDLLADRVVRRRLEHAAEVRSELRRDAEVGLGRAGRIPCRDRCARAGAAGCGCRCRCRNRGASARRSRLAWIHSKFGCCLFFVCSFKVAQDAGIHAAAAWRLRPPSRPGPESARR